MVGVAPASIFENPRSDVADESALRMVGETPPLLGRGVSGTGESEQ